MLDDKAAGEAKATGERIESPPGEDWNDPSTHPRLSATWPIVWFGFGLAVMIVYGFLSS